jgi:hypothetical protein
VAFHVSTNALAGNVWLCLGQCGDDGDVSPAVQSRGTQTQVALEFDSTVGNEIFVRRRPGKLLWHRQPGG